ncbi:MAG: hypothetical protein P1U36_07870 [Legionellaceae bacterium]|nr:hypothetical protein [Legionellaceae bacterium]
MEDVTGVPTGFFTGALVGCIGSSIAPATAASTCALGSLGVVGACAIGGAATFWGARRLVSGTLDGARNAWNDGDYSWCSALFALSAAELGGLAFLAAGIGSTCLNIAIHPVFVCALLGTAPMLAPILIATAFSGIAALGSLVCSSDNVFGL